MTAATPSARPTRPARSGRAITTPWSLGISTVAPPVTIDLLSVNDFHGRLEAAPPIAGAAVMGGMVKSYEAANPNTLFVGAGDLIGASTFTSFIQQDQPTIDAFNAMGLDASSFGNHEFDQGRADVDNRVLAEADWPYLAANLYDRVTNQPAYQEYELREMGGVTIGFIGAVTEDLPTLVSPAGIASLDVREVVPEVNRVADQLSDGNDANGEADVLVLLVHEGAATTAVSSATDDSNFGKIVNGVDADVDMIISGHTHLAYDHEIPVPGTTKVRPVISSGQYGEKYAHSVIQVDPETGELLGIQSEILNLAGAFDPDPTVAQIVADAVAVAGPLGDVSLGSISEDIKRGPSDGGHREPRRRVHHRQPDRGRAARGDRGPRHRARPHEPGRHPHRPAVRLERRGRSGGQRHLPRGGERATVRQHAGDARPDRRPAEAGARGAVAAHRGAAAVPQARRLEHARVHLRPDRRPGIAHHGDLAERRAGHRHPVDPRGDELVPRRGR